MALSNSHRTAVTPRWMLQLFWLISRKPMFRPIWQANLVSSDLLGQAHFLARAGFLIASGMMARAFVERSIKRLAMISPGWKQHRPLTTTRSYAEFLFDRGIIDQKTLGLVHTIYTRTSKICHDGKASVGGIRQTLVDCKSLSRRLEKATRRALSLAE